MTTDVRTLLHDTAEAPTRGPDLECAMRNARHRRRRHRGIGALVGVVVLALVGGVFVATSGDDAPVAIGLRQTEPSVPDGWKAVGVDPGITIAIPPGWNTYAPGDTTDGGLSRVVAGTYAPLPADGPNHCFVVPDGEGTWVRLWEFPAGTTEVAEPFGRTMPVSSRSEAFRPYSPVAAQSGCSEDIRFTHFAFVDGGRVFLAEVMSGRVPSAEAQARIDDLSNQSNALIIEIAAHRPNEAALTAQLREVQYQLQLAYNQFGMNDGTDLGVKVLDTLRVESLGTPTTTLPATTSVPVEPPPLSPTPTSFAATTDDERAIEEVFTRWADSQTDADLDAIAEDPDAVRAPSHEGWDQHPSDLALYDGQVKSIRMIDSDHAQVVYSILYAGQVAYGNRLGSAVRVDGKWKVSTETVCGMLTLGGIRCPA